MREISLTRGQVMKVDDDDHERLAAISWNGMRASKSRNWYAVNGATGLLAHRFIMGLEKGDKRQVDHIDGDSLNNQKSNLRTCSQFENQANRGANQNNTSGFKGVSWNSKRKTWQSAICANGKSYFLGRFGNAEDAYAAYCAAAVQLHGEFARVK